MLKKVLALSLLVLTAGAAVAAEEAAKPAQDIAAQDATQQADKTVAEAEANAKSENAS